MNINLIVAMSIMELDSITIRDGKMVRGLRSYALLTYWFRNTSDDEKKERLCEFAEIIKSRAIWKATST